MVADIAWDTLSGWEAMSRAVGTDMRERAPAPPLSRMSPIFRHAIPGEYPEGRRGWREGLMWSSQRGVPEPMIAPATSEVSTATREASDRIVHRERGEAMHSAPLVRIGISEADGYPLARAW